MIWAVVFLVIVLLAILLYFLKRDPKSHEGSHVNKPTSSHGLQLNATTGKVLDAVEEHTVAHGHYLGKACSLAYLSPTEAEPDFLSELNLEAQLISIDNTQAYVAQNTESIVVAFRGSEEPNNLDGFKDWLLTNARNFLVLPEGRIGTDFAAAGVGARFHRGFMSALAEVWDPLHATVEQAMKVKTRPLWVTGHSLGGAIALLAAWRFHQKFIHVHRICTFGAPMIGNNAAAEAYHREFPNKIIRYVDSCDMVPRLPTISLLSNAYDHVQREIILGSDLPTEGSSASLLLAQNDKASVDVTTLADADLDEETANGLWGDLHHGISSHLMGNYIARIEALA